MNDPHDNAQADREILERLRETGHQATYAPEEGGGFLVTCPEGCKLGTSEHQDDEDGARKRVSMHRLATAPLGPQGLKI